MNKYEGMGEPVRVVRDAGYSKIESISPENRKKALERVNDPNIVTGNYKLKELYEKIGITVNPDKMTNWYVYGDEY
jgi:hypothetical protein